MNLKKLTFGHIKGFSKLSEENQNEFIALFKDYVKNREPEKKRKNYISESQITSVFVTSQYNYRVSFIAGQDVVLKTSKIDKTENPIQEKIETEKVRLSTDIHERLKAIADEENRSMREVIDTACQFFLEHYNHNN